MTPINWTELSAAAAKGAAIAAVGQCGAIIVNGTEYIPDGSVGINAENINHITGAKERSFYAANPKHVWQEIILPVVPMEDVA